MTDEIVPYIKTLAMFCSTCTSRRIKSDLCTSTFSKEFSFIRLTFIS